MLWKAFYYSAPLLMVVVGWFVIFNGGKHLSTRSEAKDLVNELNRELTKKLSDSTEHWICTGGSTGTSEIDKKLFMQKSLAHIGYLRHLKVLFENYELSPIADDDIQTSKRLLTETPDKATRSNQQDLKDYYSQKITCFSRHVTKVIQNTNISYFESYEPTNKPIHTVLLEFTKTAGKYAILVVIVTIIFT